MRYITLFKPLLIQFISFIEVYEFSSSYQYHYLKVYKVLLIFMSLFYFFSTCCIAWYYFIFLKCLKYLKNIISTYITQDISIELIYKIDYTIIFLYSKSPIVIWMNQINELQNKRFDILKRFWSDFGQIQDLGQKLGSYRI